MAMNLIYSYLMEKGVNVLSAIMLREVIYENV